MKQKFFWAIIFIFLTGSTSAQVGKIFPALIAESLSDKKVSIPADTKGKLTLIGLAYSQKAEKALQTWLNPIYNEFIEKPENPGPFDFSYDIHLYFIPMFHGANLSFAEAAKKRFNTHLDKELKPHLLIYKGEIASYTKELKMVQEDVPYLFVLDEKGQIIHSTSGRYTESKMDKILDLLDW